MGFEKNRPYVHVDVTGEVDSRFQEVNSQLAQKATEISNLDMIKAGKDEVYLKSKGININDFDDPTRQTFLEAQGIDVNYVLGEGNVKPINTTFFKPNKNLFNPDDPDFVDGQYINSTGGFTVNSNYFTSGYIRVNEGNVIVFSNNGSKAYGFSLNYYDENKSLLSTLYGVDKALTEQTVPVGVKLARITFQKSRFNIYTTQVEVNANKQATYFIPYGHLFQSTDFFEDESFSTKHLKNESVTSIKRTELGETAHFMMPSTGVLPNVDLVNKTLTFANDTIMFYRDKFKILPQTTCDFSAIDSSAIKIFYDTKADEFVPLRYTDTVSENMVLICVIRTGNGYTSLNCPYTINGKSVYGTEEVVQNPLNAYVKGIAHRGWEYTAPENTLPAFTLAKEKGYSYVECDINWTSDGIPVLLHDDSINRTAKNADGTEITSTINILDITLAQAKTYDFGIWKGETYAGTKIPTFEEFLIHCKKMNLHPYIEPKGAITESQVQTLINIARRLGMLRRVTWVSFHKSVLESVLQYDNKARVGLVSNTLDSTVITSATALKNEFNDVFINVNWSAVTDKTLSDNVLDADLGLEVWTVWENYNIEEKVQWGITGMTITGFNLAERLQET